MTYRCQRCQFRTDDNDEAGAHMRETGHKRCIVCARSLTEDRQQTCSQCVGNVRADLGDIGFAAAMLPGVIRKSGYHNGSLPGGDALVMHGDGNAAALKPYNPSTQETRPGIDYPAIQGHSVLHPAYTDDRPVPDGKEHYADHWASDPTPIVAVLEANERWWRQSLGQPPAEDLATIIGCLGYLNSQLDRAAEYLLDFDDFATEIRTLHHRLTHVAGSANDPLRAPAKCFDCGEKRLIRVFRPSFSTSWDYRLETAVRRHKKLKPRAFLAAVAAEMTPRDGFKFEGAVDDYECAGCGREYDQESYFLALRAAASDSEGWVTVTDAALAARRPKRTIRTWADRCCTVDEKTGAQKGVPAACLVTDLALEPANWRGPIVVWWPDVYDRTFAVGRVTVVAEPEKRRRKRTRRGVRVDDHACA